MRRLQDLPVCVDLPPALAAEVAAFVETEAGWQVVARGGPPAPVLAVTAEVSDGPFVVVTDGPAPARQVADALQAGALDVIAWPQDRERLLSAPLRIRDTPRPGTAPTIVTIAAAGGGAGASTLALAVGGLAAWGGARCLVVGDDDLLRLAGIDAWDGPGSPELAALEPAHAAAEVPDVARAVAGLDGLQVLGGGEVEASFAGWPYDVVVVDRRAPARIGAADLVITTRDVSLANAARVEAAVVLRDHGALTTAQARRLLGRAPVGVVAESARVARAGQSGRVPSSLPGRWLDQVRTVLRARVGRAA